MGTFLGHYGEPRIPEERRKEFIDRAIKVLDQGGMMDIERAEMFGYKIALLARPKLDKDGVYFYYNYFEDDTWEGGIVKPDASVGAGKVGWRHFNIACRGIFVLTEFYSDTPCITKENGDIIPTRSIIGWLNYLFDEKYTNERLKDLWKTYRLIPAKCRRGDDPNDENNNLMALLPESQQDVLDIDSSLCYLFATQFDMMAKHMHEDADKDEDAFSTRRFYKVVEKHILQLKDNSGLTREQAIDACKEWITAFKNRTVNVNDLPDSEHYLAIAVTMLPLPITTRCMAAAFDLDFWKLLEEFETQIKDPVMEIPRNPKSQEPWEPEPKVSTCELFEVSDDDRAIWWTPDGDVEFSDEFNEWIKNLNEQIRALSELPTMEPAEFIKYMMKVLSNAEPCDGVHILATNEMFYDFVSNSADPLHQASIRLLEVMLSDEGCEDSEDDDDESEDEGDDDENEVSPAIAARRFLAVLGNPELRKKVFGF